MASIDVPLTKRGFGKTSRKDLWWVQPLLVFLGYLSFIIYATWAGLQGNHYLCTTACGGADYLSPMYSPLLITNRPDWWPAIIPFSAAMLILWAPGGFRFTCYYYRGAYYKAFWADPPSCTVGEPRKSYLGEKKFPLILQNVHRYFLYIAILFVFILSYDGIRALFFTAPDGSKHFGNGSGIAGADRESDFAGLVHIWVPFVPAFGRRKERRSVVIAVAKDGLRLRVVSQPATHAVGLDQHVLCGFRGFVRAFVRHGNLARLENFLNGRVPDARIRRVGGGSRRRWAARRDRGVRRWSEGRGGLEIIAGKSAYGDGRRRHGRGHGQRGRPRQLAGTFRRHHARRAVHEQLAHGRNPRQRSAGAREGTGGLGRGVRPHPRRPHPAAQFRRAPLSAAGARGRPHRPGNDPHASGSRHPSRAWSS